MQIKNIEQSDKYANEYIAQVSNGKNKNSFNLVQKFGYIFHIICLLFLMFGIIDSKVLPPKPIDLEEQEYKTFAFNCHSPHSIQYIDKEQRCNSQTDILNTAQPGDWDIIYISIFRTHKMVHI